MTEEIFNSTMLEYNITNFTESFVWKMRNEVKSLNMLDRKK